MTSRREYVRRTRRRRQEPHLHAVRAIPDKRDVIAENVPVPPGTTPRAPRMARADAVRFARVAPGALSTLADIGVILDLLARRTATPAVATAPSTAFGTEQDDADLEVITLRASAEGTAREVPGALRHFLA